MAYNNIKNISTDYNLFELNYNYYLQILLNKNTNACFNLMSTNNHSLGLRKVKIIYYKFFFIILKIFISMLTIKMLGLEVIFLIIKF